MAKRPDQRPATVPFGATPAGQPPTVKEWANRHVWTDRMLDALQTDELCPCNWQKGEDVLKAA